VTLKDLKFIFNSVTKRNMSNVVKQSI
jgi:hypothetical protein